jgi:hypothetical protein
VHLASQRIEATYHTVPGALGMPETRSRLLAGALGFVTFS